MPGGLEPEITDNVDVAGIGWEIVKESVEMDGGKFPDFAKVPQRHYMNQVFTNQFLHAILAEPERLLRSRRLHPAG